MRRNILLPLLGLVAASCSFQQEDFFDLPAAQRIEHTNAEVKSLLVEGSTGATPGWIMQYFVAGTDRQKFEGFNIFASFQSNGRVTLSSDHRYLRDGRAGQYTQYVSNFEMLKEEGTVLAFNTWNDVLSVFVDPVNPNLAPDVIDDDGEGMYGDDRLVLLSYSPTEMLFRGERHNGEVHLQRLDCTPQEYLQGTADFKKRISNTQIAGYYVTRQGSADTLYLTHIEPGYFRLVDRLEDPLKSTDVSCVFSPDAMRLGRPLPVLGDTCQLFQLAPDATCLTSGDVRITACWDQLVASHTDIWFFDHATLTPAQQQAYARIADQLLQYNRNYELIGIGLGRTTGGNAVQGLVVQFYSNANRTRVMTCGIELGTSLTSFGQITFSVADNPTRDTNLSNLTLRAPALPQELHDFAVQTLQGSFSVTPNDYFLPTGCTFTPEGQGNQAFSVQSQL